MSQTQQMLLSSTADLQLNISVEIKKYCGRISQYYERVMGIGYDSEVYFAQIFSIGPSDQYYDWAFTVTPTIVMDVDRLQTKIDLDIQKNTGVNTFTIIAHEMAHKYFMQLFNASGTKNLWRFYHESLAQFLAYKAVNEMYGDSAYWEQLGQGLTDEYRSRVFAPLLDIEDTDKPLVNASYFYYPLVLAGFEKMFGEQKTFSLLQELVNQLDAFAGNIDYFLSCIKATGINKEAFEDFLGRFLLSENFLKEWPEK